MRTRACGAAGKHSMRIDDKHMAGIGAPGLDRAQWAESGEQRAGRTAPDGAGGVQTDRVSLSGLAARIQALEDGSAERKSRLEALAAAYREGRLETDGEAVGEAVIEEALAGRGAAGDPKAGDPKAGDPKAGNPKAGNDE
ncbi:MAG: hypothetical protein HY858_09135 [Candidatus Solibacter usitatus]|nr:hypothetical protein [Candidatus Solibacter usitatus]